MIRLLGLVLSIGLADSLNPSTVGPGLFLASGDAPRRRVALFAVGTFGVFFLGGLLLTLGPGRAILALVPRPDPTVRYILEIVAGVGMLVAGLVLWVRRESLGSQEEVARKHRDRGSPLLMGAGISIVELPTAFPYFAAIAAIVGSGLSVASQLTLVLVYDIAFVLPLIVIVVTLTVAGDRAVEQLTRARNFMHRHWPLLAAGVALVAGVFVTILGVTGLTGRNHGRLGHISRRVRRLLPH